MYNPIYSPLREVVNAAAYGESFDGLARTTEVRMEEGWKKGRREELGREICLERRGEDRGDEERRERGRE